MCVCVCIYIYIEREREICGVGEDSACWLFPIFQTKIPRRKSVRNCHPVPLPVISTRACYQEEQNERADSILGLS